MLLALVIAMQVPTSGTRGIAHPDQAQLDAISDECRTPKKWLRYVGGDEIRFKPAQNAKYEKVECLLAQLRKSSVPMNFGFIGNEALPESEKK
jgi:hypothetical protein